MKVIRKFLEVSIVVYSDKDQKQTLQLEDPQKVTQAIYLSLNVRNTIWFIVTRICLDVITSKFKSSPKYFKDSIEGVHFDQETGTKTPLKRTLTLLVIAKASLTNWKRRSFINVNSVPVMVIAFTGLYFYFFFLSVCLYTVSMFLFCLCCFFLNS